MVHMSLVLRSCFLASRAFSVKNLSRPVVPLCPLTSALNAKPSAATHSALRTTRACASNISTDQPSSSLPTEKNSIQNSTPDSRPKPSQGSSHPTAPPHPVAASVDSPHESDAKVSAVDTDATFSAFDAFLQESGLLDSARVADEDDDSLSRKERRAIALEREREFKKQQYFKRLEILTALPDNLTVLQVPDKCPGCGCELQSKDESLPGYLPEEIRTQRAKDVLEVAGVEPQIIESQEPPNLDHFEDETAMQQSPKADTVVDRDNFEHLRLKDVEMSEEWEEVVDPTKEEMVEDPNKPFGGLLTEEEVEDLRSILSEEGIELSANGGDGKAVSAKNTIVCQRCFRLSNYGVIEPELRVESPRKLLERPVKSVQKTDDVGKVSKSAPKSSATRHVLTPATFRQNLEKLRKQPAVIIYLVDVFDFHGTFLSGLRDLIGSRSPVIMAVNKVDLLPKDYKPDRVERWVRHEARSLGLDEIESVHLISSLRGSGVKPLLADALSLARKRNDNIYVVGAANVGKSSFINYVMSVRLNQKRDSAGRRDYRSKKTDGFRLTTSVIPGTTLDVIRVPLDAKVSLYDTPGIIMPHQLTNSLDPKELRAVIPSKNIERVSLRLGEGKALYLGGLARIEVVEGRPFFFTAFVSADVKVHPGRTDDADEFTRRHVGQMLTPPYDVERWESLGEWSSKSFTAEGDGWRRACVDIVLSGLGWVSLTGVGQIRVRISTPRGVGVFTREALMPFEVQTSGVSKYTGAAVVNVREANKAARKRKSRKYAEEERMLS